ncbi:hypothetical protein F5B19DRAFT_56006 [Rostrohypoxylon terebratum]|nr:hypothetical protein F5B19DRAFT_56006 [Rostrohypoxylon terebratum]
MTSTDNDSVWRPGASFDKNKAQWPQQYSLRPPSEGERRRIYWKHTYYRGPKNQPIQILYSSDRQHSEVIAQGFLDEPVLGFDMEWPMDSYNRSRLQEKVALIQIACARKIALFHIALHDGETSEELIAPTLRRIIESPSIIKTGVAIMNADFVRLKDYFGLNPRGAFELSHLNNLVVFGSQNPDRVTTRLRALTKITEEHLGLPLYKGSVRRSDWSLPLDEDQKQYAADDAYVAFMLFHRMNAKRLEMTPIPPLPKLAESYLPFTFPNVMPAQLESVTEGPNTPILTARDFFTSSRPIQPRGKEVTNQMYGTLYGVPNPQENRLEAKEVKKTIDNSPKEPEFSQELYEKLVLHRRQKAKAKNVSAFVVAYNKVLETLARYRPTNKEELLAMHGIGPNKVSLYGDEWLEIISKDVEKRPKKASEEIRVPLKEKASNKVMIGGNKDGQKPPVPRLNEELYQRLYEHRRTQADIRGCRPYMLATNLVLEALARECPQNMQELRAIEGTQSSQINAYGPAWLRIIAGYQADKQKKPVYLSVSETPAQTYPDDFFQQPALQRNDQSPTRKRIKQVGRSKELLVQPEAKANNTGISFEFRQFSLEADEAPAQSDDIVACFDLTDEPASKSPTRSSPNLKRKRVECSNSPCEDTGTTAAPLTLSEPPAPLPGSETASTESPSPQQKILMKKLDAYVKSVVFLMKPKPTQPIVSEDTLQRLVMTLPRTLDEFRQLPGIEDFLQACQGVKKDLWLTFSTWTRTAGLVPNT